MSGAIVSATPSSGTKSTLLGRATFEAFEVSRRVKAPKDPESDARAGNTAEDRDGSRTVWKVKAEAEPALDIAPRTITFREGRPERVAYAPRPGLHLGDRGNDDVLRGRTTPSASRWSSTRARASSTATPTGMRISRATRPTSGQEPGHVLRAAGAVVRNDAPESGELSFRGQAAKLAPVVEVPAQHRGLQRDRAYINSYGGNMLTKSPCASSGRVSRFVELCSGGAGPESGCASGPRFARERGKRVVIHVDDDAGTRRGRQRQISFETSPTRSRWLRPWAAPWSSSNQDNIR